jgi:prephenate dehydrogenase
MTFQKLAVIGCGLMGGSFALGLKQDGWVKTIAGFSASEKTRQRAQELQIIDVACDNVAQAVQGADLVLLAVPVSATRQSLEAIVPTLSPNALLMDVGSTKCDVVAAARQTLGERLSCFVPAHPIAGKEVAGIDHAEGDLYKNRRTILTPLAETGAHQISQAKAVWQALGSTVFTMTPEAHDATFAAVSHLPHLLAFATVNGLMAQSEGEDFLRMAGPGFRDFSRIAGSDPAVWRDILSANRTEVLSQITHFKQALAQLEEALQNQDPKALQSLIAQASQVRSAWRLQATDATNLASDA